jgi:outer membrane lipoprotein SlyB
MPQKHHPMMIIAAVAVVLFCAVGIAAMMGWLPSSIGGNATAQTEQQEQKQEQEQKKEQEQKQEREQKAQAADQAAADKEQAAQRADEKQAQAAIEAPCSNCGVVQSIREINTRAEGSGVGAAGGAVVGGLLGNQVGGGHGRQLATIAGAIGGAVAGNQIEGNVKASRSYDITVQLDSGNNRTIRQSAQPRWSVGDQVRIVDGQIRSN